MIRETYNQAKDKEDWRGMLEVIRLVMAYAVGKPVSKVITAQVDADEIRDIFRELATGGVGYDNAIDVTDLQGETTIVSTDDTLGDFTEEGDVFDVSGDSG
jgi:hypothetical protein